MVLLSDLSKKKKKKNNVFIGRVKNSLTQFICIYYLYLNISISMVLRRLNGCGSFERHAVTVKSIFATWYPTIRRMLPTFRALTEIHSEQDKSSLKSVISGSAARHMSRDAWDL